MRDFGIRAVVSVSIADIFFSNALKNGLVQVIDELGYLLAHLPEIEAWEKAWAR